MIPLETTILYSPDSYPNHYWTAERNTTEWSLFMRELTTSGNAIAKLMLEAFATFAALKPRTTQLLDLVLLDEQTRQTFREVLHSM